MYLDLKNKKGVDLNIDAPKLNLQFSPTQFLIFIEIREKMEVCYWK